MKVSLFDLLSQLQYVEPVLCGTLLYFMVRSKTARNFGYLLALLCVRFICSVVCISLLHLSGHGIERHLAYQIYFYVYWTSFALEAILSLLVIYGIFKLAMAPLKGLQTLGMLVFRWVAAISVAVAIGVAVSPHQSANKFMIAMITQLQQTSSILTLCLLLFVCFAIRPMGLSFRSRIFGISLGLGFLAAINLVNSAWLAHNQSMYSLFSLINVRGGQSDPAHMVRLLRLPGAEAPDYRSPDHVALPSLEPDLNGSGRRSGLCCGWRNPAGALCPGRA